MPTGLEPTINAYLRKPDGTLYKIAGGGGGSSTPGPIDALTDVDTVTVAPAVGNHLVWDGTNWVPRALPSPVAQPLDWLSDVDTTTVAPTSGHVLSWNGTVWIPAAPAAGGGTGDVGSTWCFVHDNAGLSFATDAVFMTLDFGTLPAGSILCQQYYASTTVGGTANNPNLEHTPTNISSIYGQLNEATNGVVWWRVAGTAPTKIDLWYNTSAAYSVTASYHLFTRIS